MRAIATILLLTTLVGSATLTGAHHLDEPACEPNPDAITIADRIHVLQDGPIGAIHVFLERNGLEGLQERGGTYIGGIQPPGSPPPYYVCSHGADLLLV